MNDKKYYYCLNLVFQQHNDALLVVGGDFNVHITSDTIQSQLLSDLFRGFGLLEVKIVLIVWPRIITSGITIPGL